MSSASRRRPSIAGTVALHVGSRANVRMASSGERGCTASPGDVVGVAHHLLRELVRLRRSDDDVIPLLEQPLHLLAERAVLARMLDELEANAGIDLVQMVCEREERAEVPAARRLSREGHAAACGAVTVTRHRLGAEVDRDLPMQPDREKDVGIVELEEVVERRD